MKETPIPDNLVGLQLSIARHAASMLNLQFGNMVREGDQSWGEIALHIQSPWRIYRGDALLVGSNDRWNPINEVEDLDEWYRSPHPSREDRFWLGFLGTRDSVTSSYESNGDFRIVTKVEETKLGDIIIHFDDGSVLETFASGTDDEFWRIFNPRVESPHYVSYLEDEDTEYDDAVES